MSGTSLRPALSIRAKLFALVLIVAVPALAVVLFAGLRAGNDALQFAQREAMLISHDLLLRQQQHTASTRQFLATLSHLPQVRGLDGKACAPLFAELLKANPVYSDILLMDTAGNVLASAQIDQPDLNLSGTGYFKEAMRTGSFAVGGYRKSRTTGLDVMVCAHPVVNARREIIGLVSTGLRLSSLDESVQGVDLPEGSSIVMADREGLRLFHRCFPQSEPNHYPLGQPIRFKQENRLETASNGQFFFDTSLYGVRKLYVLQSLRLRQEDRPYLYVGVGLSERAILARSRRTLRFNLTLLGLAALVSVAAAYVIGRKAMAERIERLALVAGNFAQGQFSARAELPGNLFGGRDELDRLGQAMDHIGEELSRREAERASHLERLERTQFAMDHAGDEMYWADAQGRLLYVNQRAAASLGYTREEMLKLTVFDLAPDYTPRHWRLLLRWLAGNGPTTMQVNHRTRVGASTPKEVSFTLLPGDGPPLVFGSGRDISSRVRHEAVLRSILDETAGVTGQDFFDALTLQLTRVLEMPAAFVGEYIPGNPVRVRGLSLRLRGRRMPQREHLLSDTVGPGIPESGHLLVQRGLLERFARATTLLDSGMQGYLGVPLLDPDGCKIGHMSIMSQDFMPDDPQLIAIMRLFAQRASAELLNLQAEREMRASLREKEVLLKEIHHRVKNNMQIVSSLLSLQARDVADPAMLELLAESRSRILSMALVHEDLYQSGNLAQVDFRRYLERLTERVRAGIGGASGVDFRLELDPLALAVDQAIPLGLLANELLTNALKHAFPVGGAGVVRVLLRRETDMAELEVADNGRGLPESFDPESGATLGMQLVWSLADQLRGRMEFMNGPGGGAVFRVRFPVD